MTADVATRDGTRRKLDLRFEPGTVPQDVGAVHGGIRLRRLQAVNADAVELRVLGCLIEKQATTPDQYPLSLNALRLAANQSTNRDPVVDYDETTIRAALERLGDRGWTRLASGAGSRAVKFRHLLGDALDLEQPQLALLAVLMLRGPQTAAELRTRSERLHPFASGAEVAETLDGLARRELVERLARRPGEREERWRQLLGEPGAAEDAPDPTAAGGSRLDELERRIAGLEARLDAAGL
jgi:uncharacterized protein YceH (UPF0502 family)